MTSEPPPGGPSWQQEPAASHPAGPPASSPFFRWVRGLGITRAPDRWVGGVAGGVARRTGMDIALVRGLIVILAVFGGIGVLLYGLAWALLPEPDGRIHLEQAGRGSWTSGLTGAAAFVAIGFWRPNLPFLGGDGTGALLWTLFWIGAVVLFVYWIINRSAGGQARRDVHGGPGGGPSDVTGGPDRSVPPSGPAKDPGSPARPGPDGPPPTTPHGEAPTAGPAAGPGGRTPDDGSPHEGPTGVTDGGPVAGGPDGTPDGDTDGAPGSAQDDAVHRTVPLPYQPRPYSVTEPWTQHTHPTGPLPYDPGSSSWSGSTFPVTYPGPVAGPPPATRYRPPRPSGPVTAVLVGGAVVVAATVLALDYLGAPDLVEPVVVALAAAAVVLALGIIGLGVRGRTSGMVGVAAAFAVVGALMASFSIGGATWIVAQDERLTPVSLQSAAGGYSALAAQATIDLTGLPPLSSDVVVPVNSLASDVTVVVPDDVPVEFRTRMALGNAGPRGTLEGSDGSPMSPRSEGGLLLLRNGTLNPDATGSAIILDLRGAMSDVSVVTDSEDASLPSNSSPIPTGDTP
ncbi:PspC domain-containing protein [Arthrobacter sp. Ld5]|uniref:PspC domain-containing protein n=1 Tax=Arthrobacter sp. Ld5 TaxID=649152 RepID=UPI003EBF0D57